MRVLVTGFAAFPGAPYNPTPELVKTLAKTKRPALFDVEILTHVFPVTYQAVDDQLPKLLTKHKPDVLLMFGLAARTPYVRIETRARNAISTLWPDADHKPVRRNIIVRGGPADRHFRPFTALLYRKTRATGVPVQLSRDAGRYLCNYLCWRALETKPGDNAPRLTAFIHVPQVPRRGALTRPGQVSSADLVRAGIAILTELVSLAKRG
jgi:pyroglutamyl-peptidase